MKKNLYDTYSDIRCAIAFIMRNERGVSQHLITRAATQAAGILHGVEGLNPSSMEDAVQSDTEALARSLGFKQRKQPFPFR